MKTISKQPARRPAFKPADLDRYPEVDALLTALGLGSLDRDSVQAPVGRNDVWAGTTSSGRQVFVKRLLGHRDDARSRMRRLLSFERFAQQLPPGALHHPRLLGIDEEACLVVFEYLGAAGSGAQLMVDESFGDELAYAIGAAVGTLHATRPADPAGLDQSPPPQPSPELLHGIPLPMFENLTFAELEAWGLLQRDEPLLEAVQRLRERERAAPKVPAHCDLRVDQFLIEEDRFYITDWEEFRLADGARDVGSFAGEWLCRAVLDIPTSRGDATFVDFELTHELVLQRGVEKMQRLLPRVHHFWRGYRQSRPYLDGGFAARATAFAGWHLLDRMIAGATKTARLSGIQRAAAGVGRAALLHPEKFAATLGFEEGA